MPMIIVRYVTPTPRPALRGQVAELARTLGAEVLGKDPNVTAVLVEEADPDGWFVAGERPARAGKSAFWLDIKITAGTSGDTFNFTGSFGGIVVTNYLPGSETINWDRNDFANIAAVESHARQDGAGDTVITLDANDTITLVGVTLSQFEAHTSDWHFI